MVGSEYEEWLKPGQYCKITAEKAPNSSRFNMKIKSTFPLCLSNSAQPQNDEIGADTFRNWQLMAAIVNSDPLLYYREIKETLVDDLTRTIILVHQKCKDIDPQKINSAPMSSMHSSEIKNGDYFEITVKEDPEDHSLYHELKNTFPEYIPAKEEVRTRGLYNPEIIRNWEVFLAIAENDQMIPDPRYKIALVKTLMKILQQAEQEGIIRYEEENPGFIISGKIKR